MFPSTDKVLGLGAVFGVVNGGESDFPPAECIRDVLKLCLESNNSVF